MLQRGLAAPSGFTPFPFSTSLPLLPLTKNMTLLGFVSLETTRIGDHHLPLHLAILISHLQCSFSSLRTSVSDLPCPFTQASTFCPPPLAEVALGLQMALARFLFPGFSAAPDTELLPACHSRGFQPHPAVFSESTVSPRTVLFPFTTTRFHLSPASRSTDPQPRPWSTRPPMS